MPEQVKPHHLTVTGTLEDVLAWVSKMGERGIYNASTARFKQNAIEQFTEVLGPEEPRTAEYLKENIDEIARRYATKVSANPDTARTYKSRAFGAVTDYLAFQENPSSIKAKGGPARASASKKPSGKSTSTKAGEPEPTLAAPPSPDPVRPTEGPMLRTFPLGKTREPFSYVLPDGMLVADVIKIACHLVTLAEDFDPMNASTAAVFSLARRDQ